MPIQMTHRALMLGYKLLPRGKLHFKIYTHDNMKNSPYDKNIFTDRTITLLSLFLRFNTNLIK